MMGYVRELTPGGYVSHYFEVQWRDDIESRIEQCEKDMALLRKERNRLQASLKEPMIRLGQKLRGTYLDEYDMERSCRIEFLFAQTSERTYNFLHYGTAWTWEGFTLPGTGVWPLKDVVAAFQASQHQADWQLEIVE